MDMQIKFDAAKELAALQPTAVSVLYKLLASQHTPPKVLLDAAKFVLAMNDAAAPQEPLQVIVRRYNASN